MKLFNITLGILLALVVRAQVPTPAPAQSTPILITGATIHVGDGSVIENGSILFDKGKIVAVGTNVNAPANAKKIDAKGKQIYPGFIAPATTLGINEIDAIRPTHDMREVGGWNPNVRSLVAYNTDSRVTPTVRSNGILLAEVAPQGGRISGTSSVVQLDAWNWQDAAYGTDNGIHMNWPAFYHHTGWWAEPGPTELNKKYDDQVKEVTDYFTQAKAYSELDKPEVENQKFESMRGLFDGSEKLFVHVDGAREILAVIDFKRATGLNVVIVGGSESWRVADHLKENNIPVVYEQVHSLPDYPEDDVEQPYKTPAMLAAAGVDFCFGLGGSWEQRNLMFHAGTAVAYGLDPETAVAALTSKAAQILGVGDKVGVLKPGMDATLFISTGDALDMRTSIVEYAFINGRQIDLDNKQKDLYRKFSNKYK